MTNSQQPQQVPPVVRDTVMMALGAGGIIYQQVTGQVSEILLGLYALLLGGPSLAGLWSLLRGVGGTTGGSSESPVPPDSSPSDSSSTTSGGGSR